MIDGRTIENLKKILSETASASGCTQVDYMQRKRALEQFINKGFPDRTLERWRFTPIDHLQLYKQGRPVLQKIQPESYIHPYTKDGTKIVFIDGLFSPEASQLIDNRVSVKQSACTAPQQGNSSQSFELLNQALCFNVIHIQTTHASRIDLPVRLIHISTGNGPYLQCARITIVVSKGSAVSFIENHIGLGSETSISDTVTDLTIMSGASCRYYQHINEECKGSFLNHLNSTIMGSGNLEYGSFMFGGDFVWNEMRTIFDKPDSSAEIVGLNIAQGKQYHDMHFDIEHRVNNCRSDVFIRNLLEGSSKAVTDVKTKVYEGAFGTEGQQLINSMLLSENAVINAMPRLEIYADDVMCSHGATVGDLDPETVFYMKSRGLDPETARKILLEAFASAIIQKISCEYVRDMVRTACASAILNLTGGGNG